MFTSSTNINSNLLLRLSVTCCCAALLSHNLSRFFSSLLFSPASQRASATALGSLLPLNFDSSPMLRLSSRLFPSLLFASLSTFLCTSPRHSPPLDVPHSRVFSRNPELFLISPYICSPHSSLCRTRSQMLPVLPACWQITVGMCHS